MAPNMIMESILVIHVHVVLALLLGRAHAQIPDKCQVTTVSECVYDCTPPVMCLYIYNNDETMHEPLMFGGVGPFCCAGYFLTTNNVCQICNDVRYMPGINNCTCACYDCKDCDYKWKEDCNRISNRVCRNDTAPTSIQALTCPVIASTSNPITITGTSKPTTPFFVHSTVKEASDPEYQIPAESKSEWTSREKGLAAFLGLLIFVVGSFVVLICCYMYFSGRGRDEPDMGNRSWRDVMLIVRSKIGSTVRCRNIAVPGGDGGGAGAGAEAGGGAVNVPVNAPAAGGQEGNQSSHDETDVPGERTEMLPVPDSNAKRSRKTMLLKWPTFL